MFLMFHCWFSPLIFNFCHSLGSLLKAIKITCVSIKEKCISSWGQKSFNIKLSNLICTILCLLLVVKTPSATEITTFTHRSLSLILILLLTLLTSSKFYNLFFYLAARFSICNFNRATDLSCRDFLIIGVASSRNCLREMNLRGSLLTLGLAGQSGAKPWIRNQRVWKETFYFCEGILTISWNPKAVSHQLVEPYLQWVWFELTFP